MRKWVAVFSLLLLVLNMTGAVQLAGSGKRGRRNSVQVIRMGQKFQTMTAIAEQESERAQGPNEDAEDVSSKLDAVLGGSDSGKSDAGSGRDAAADLDKELQGALEAKDKKEEAEEAAEKEEEKEEEEGAPTKRQEAKQEKDAKDVHAKLDEVLKSGATVKKVDTTEEEEAGDNEGEGNPDDNPTEEGEAPQKEAPAAAAGSSSAEAASGSDAGSGSGSNSGSKDLPAELYVDKDVDIASLGPNPMAFSQDCRLCILLVTRGIARKDNLVDLAAPCTANDERWRPACLKYYSEHAKRFHAALDPSAVCSAAGVCTTTENEEWTSAVQEVGKANKGGSRVGSSRLERGLVTIVTKNSPPTLDLDNGDGQRFYRQQVAFKGKPFPVPPFVSIALTDFDILSNDDMRVIVTVENISEAGFVLVLQTWGKSRIEMIGATWIAYDKAFSERRDIWSGTSRFTMPLKDAEVLSNKIFFPAAMSITPVVSVGLEGIDAEHVGDPSLALNVTDVTRYGFTVTIRGKVYSKVDSAAVSWIALDPRATEPVKDVQSGIVAADASTPGFENFWSPPLGTRSYVIRVDLKSKLDNPPVVDLRLVDFTFARAVPERLKMVAEDVTRSGFNIKVETWADTRLQNIAISWIALPGPIVWTPEKSPFDEDEDQPAPDAGSEPRGVGDAQKTDDDQSSTSSASSESSDEEEKSTLTFVGR